MVKKQDNLLSKLLILRSRVRKAKGKDCESVNLLKELGSVVDFVTLEKSWNELYEKKDSLIEDSKMGKEFGERSFGMIKKLL